MSLYPYAIIFAGGKSSRMGKDKALLPFGKHSSLTAYQYEKLKKVFHTVFISAKEDKFDFECQVISDIYKVSSPLVGILSIFETHEALDAIFILSVDVPFVEEAVIHTIMQETNHTFDAIVAKTSHGLQPLCGLYRRSILKHAHIQFKENNHKLQDLLALVKTKIITFEDDSSFTNLNHPKEYEDALKRSLT